MVNPDVCLFKHDIAAIDIKKKIKLYSIQMLLKISKIVKGELKRIKV